MLKFVWDENKRQKNLKKHGLDFADAEKTFHDDYAFFAPDPRYNDDRWLLLGRLVNKIVLIAYTQPEAETYRIISMRRPKRQEIARYELEKLKRLPSANDPLFSLIEELERNRSVEIDKELRDTDK